MGTLDGLIELFKVTYNTNVFPVPFHHRKGLTGPLAGLLPTLLQYAGIKTVLELLGVSFPEVKGCVVGAATVGGRDF